MGWEPGPDEHPFVWDTWPDGDDVVRWNPRSGNTGDDRYLWPEDLPVRLGPHWAGAADADPGSPTIEDSFANPAAPTLDEVNACYGLNQIVAECIRRRNLLEATRHALVERADAIRLPRLEPNMIEGFVGERPAKRCRHCAEVVREEATVCPHCTRPLQPARSSFAATPTQWSTDAERLRSAAKSIGRGTIILNIGLLVWGILAAGGSYSYPLIPTIWVCISGIALGQLIYVGANGLAALIEQNNASR